MVMVVVVVMMIMTVAYLDDHLCTHWSCQRCEKQQQQEAPT